MKKKIVAILVLVLVVAASVFSLAACNEEEPQISDFERYAGWRYLTDYTYDRIGLFKWNNEQAMWSDVVTWWDTDSPVSSSDDLRGYDYLINYTDGDYSNPEWNALFLDGKRIVESLGKTIGITRDEVKFSGTLGDIPITAVDYLGNERAEMELEPNATQKEEANLVYYYFVTTHFSGTSADTSPDVVQLFFATEAFELEGHRYRMQFTYSAQCTCDDD